MKTLKLANLVALFGFAALAVLPASAKEWTYYAKGAEGSPASTVDCITDGNWVLQVSKLDASTGTIVIGVGSYTTGIKQGSGILDLRGVVTVDGVAYDKKKFGTDVGRQYTGGLVEFHADNVEAFGGRAFHACKTLTTVSISGSFGELGGDSFNQCTSLTNVVLNSPNLATIGASAFQESRKIVAIEITTEKAVTVANTAMNWGSALTSLTVNGPAWATTSVDNLLQKNEASDTAKKCTIYANKDTWFSLASAVTDAEKSYAPKKCFGVYREGLRKAWLVANNADPVPFRIIIR